ncbi:MAG: tryptophan-rich sensory protein [Sphingomonas bacterium]|nr:tryptophan-rich sensory protein [Sphingomonas bacterium]
MVALVVELRPISQLASLLVVPYLLWFSFATWLNWTIVRLNRPFGSRPLSSPRTGRSSPAARR